MHGDGESLHGCDMWRQIFTMPASPYSSIGSPSGRPDRSAVCNSVEQAMMIEVHVAGGTYSELRHVEALKKKHFWTGNGDWRCLTY